MMGARIRIGVFLLLALLLTSLPSVSVVLLMATSLSQQQRALVSEMLIAQLPVVLIFWLLWTVLVYQLIAWLWREYPLRLARLAENLRLVADQPRTKSLDIRGSDAVVDVAMAANQLIARITATEEEIFGRIQVARGMLVDERNWLAALMADLSVGVVVCNNEGCVLLYNKRARLQVKALQHAAHVVAQDALLGLGRSIFTIFSREEISRQLDAIRAAADDPSLPGIPHIYLHAILPSTLEGLSLRAHLSPVLGVSDASQLRSAVSRRDLNGFVLIMDHVTSAAPLAMHAPDIGDDAEQVIESRPEYYDFDLFAARDLIVDLDKPLQELVFTAFDTETTGLDPSAGDEIIQLGAVRIVNGRILRNETFDQLVDPGRPLTESNIAIHGITDERLRGKPKIQQILPAFHAFCADTVLVAHNAAFDMRFLEMKESMTGIRFGHPVLDTLLLSDLISPHQESHRLEEIAARMGIPVVGRHTALGDAVVTARVFVAMLPLLHARGFVTLRQVLAATRRSNFARLTY